MRQVTILDVGPGALADYYEWFRHARSGSTLVYWRGNLSFDRDIENFVGDSFYTEREPVVLALDAIAKRIFADGKDGVIILTQRKLGFDHYEYRAMRVQTRKEKELSLISGLVNA